MKLQVTQENLNRALNSVARIASSHSTLPILANVLIKTDGNRLSLASTNLDVGISHYIGAKVSQAGSITVPAKLMQEFVASLPGGVINLELEETKLKISTDKYQSIVNGIVADDFPVMPAFKAGKNWKINAGTLKKSLQQVIFAASSDETRPVLTGVFVHSLDKKLHLTATDSSRLAEKAVAPSSAEISILVPASAMSDLLRVLGEEEESVQVTEDEQQVLFKIGDIELVARLLDGQYPNYQNLIPKKFNTEATLKRQDLINVTKVSSLFARESAGSITIEISEESQSLNIKSVASQLGENNAEASAKASGSGSITLNSRYLLEALNAFEGEEITFGFNSKVEPTLISNPKNPDYKHVIMPLRS